MLLYNISYWDENKTIAQKTRRRVKDVPILDLTDTEKKKENPKVALIITTSASQKTHFQKIAATQFDFF